METIWNYGFGIILACLFLFLFLKLRKKSGGFFWLIATLCMLPVAVSYHNHFISNIPISNCCLVLWLSGMIFAWYRLSAAGAILYFILDLLSLPSALFYGIAYTTFSWQFVTTAFFFVLLMILNTILIFMTMKNTKTA